jgi:hypothetical protein
MARVKNAEAGEDIPAEEDAASTPSAAADNLRKTLSARATWTATRRGMLNCQQNLSRRKQRSKHV